MIPTRMVIHKTFADFVLFLYLHMAYADGKCPPSEKRIILEKMSKIFPNEADLSKKLDEAEKEYLRIYPAEIPGLILDTFKQFNEVKFAQKYKVYTDMYDIINADGKVEESETDALETLKKVINLGAEANA